jgi:hypothetical protein
MTKKMMLLALAVVSAVMFALPAVASAGSPLVECGGVACGKFTSHGGTSVLSTTSGTTVTCTTNTGSGSFTSTTTGTIKLTFSGCKESIFSTSCNTSGQASGVVVTTESVFHTTYLTDDKKTPGVLVTPGANEHFSSFECAGGFSNHVVKGNGVMGRLTAPPCGGTSATKSLTLSFEDTAHGAQTYKQITGTGTIYDLNDNGTTASMEAEGTVTLASNPTITCV